MHLHHDIPPDCDGYLAAFAAADVDGPLAAGFDRLAADLGITIAPAGTTATSNTSPADEIDGERWDGLS